MQQRSALPAISLAMLLSTSSPAAAKDNPQCGEHPLFSRFSGEELDNCDHSR